MICLSPAFWNEEVEYVLFEEWMDEHKLQKKVVFVDQVCEANRLIRRYNETGRAVMNLQVMKLVDLAQSIVMKKLAASDKVQEFRLYSQQACAVMVEKLLRESDIVTFIPKESISRKTAEEVLRVMNIFRSGATKNSVPANWTKRQERWEQWNQLIAAYEEQLQSKNAFDEILLLKAACEILGEDALDDDDEEDTLYGRLEPMELTYLDKCLIDKISGGLCQELTYLSDEKKEQVKYHFQRGYGVVNEVEAVVDRILKERQAYGTVNILYANEAQAAYIQSGLEKAGIPYTMTSGRNAMANPYLSLVKKILLWAKDDCRKPILEMLEDSPCFDQQKIWEELYSDEYKSLTDKAERRERAWEEYRRLSRDQKAERRLQLRDELRGIFTEENAVGDEKDLAADTSTAKSVSVSEVYARLLDFLQRYKYNRNASWRVAKPLLEDVQSVVTVVGEVSTMSEAIDELLSALEMQRISEEERNDAVSVMSVRSRHVLERKHNYILGLSTENLQLDSKESPIWTDAELKECIDDSKGYVPYATTCNERQRRILEDILASVVCGEVIISYSNYDMQNQRESSPARIYMDWLREYGQNIDLSEIPVSTYKRFPYRCVEEDVLFEEEETKDSGHEEQSLADEKENVDECDSCNDYDIYDDYDNFDDEKDEEDRATIEKKRSPSALQTALHCPRQYYYRYVRSLLEPIEKEKDVSIWLDASQKGNLVHKILQEYCEACFVNRSKEEYVNYPEIDSDQFNSIYNRCVTEALKKYPCDQAAVVKITEEEISNITQWYLNHLHQELSREDNPWKVEACEYDIDKAQENSSQKKSYCIDYAVYDSVLELLYTGIIDRVDSYEDNQGGKHYRLIDYKTGNREKLNKKIKAELQIQHILYAKALEGDKAVIDEFVYQFFAEEGDVKEHQIVCPRTSLKELSETVETVIYQTLCAHNYESEGRLCDKGDYKKPDLCKYCSYVHICKEGVGGEL